jgi:hypothetical protein
MAMCSFMGMEKLVKTVSIFHSVQESLVALRSHSFDKINIEAMKVALQFVFFWEGWRNAKQERTELRVVLGYWPIRLVECVEAGTGTQTIRVSWKLFTDGSLEIFPVPLWCLERVIMAQWAPPHKSVSKEKWSGVGDLVVRGYA